MALLLLRALPPCCSDNEGGQGDDVDAGGGSWKTARRRAVAALDLARKNARSVALRDGRLGVCASLVISGDLRAVTYTGAAVPLVPCFLRSQVSIIGALRTYWESLDISPL